jgi:hypothetical protein
MPDVSFAAPPETPAALRRVSRGAIHGIHAEITVLRQGASLFLFPLFFLLPP